MLVKLLVEHSEQIDKLATKTWPKGWQGAIDDETGRRLVGEGKAEEVKSDAPSKVELTDAQKAVLASAANEILTNQAAKKAYDEAAAKVTAIHPQTGEALEDLKVAELRELAEQLDLDPGNAKKAELIEAIVAKVRDIVGLTAAQAVLDGAKG